MVTKRIGSRTQKKPPRKDPKLTQREAKVLFIIWKIAIPSTYREIAAKHNEYFRRTISEGNVKCVVNSIKHLQEATNRKYLHESGGKPKTYSISENHFVNRKRSSVILLELDKGFEQLSEYKPLEWEIRREQFEHYMFLTYGWDPSFTKGRIDDACNSGYVSLDEKVEEGRVFINIGDRLNDDLEYLKLLVNDYCIHPREKIETSIIEHMKDLLMLYQFSV